jgi:ribosome biogenesis GTPase A
MSSQYASIRDGLLEIVHKLSQINMDGGHKRLDELSEKLTFEQFNLVVMGQFKRGKSTLINALLGAEILPTSIVPLTSIVTILRYGRESKAVVRYLNDAHPAWARFSSIIRM